MSEFWSAIWEFLSGLPRDFFGDRVDTGWGIAFALYVSVVAISFAIGAYRSIGEVSKAIDVRFDKGRLAAYNSQLPSWIKPRVIDWFRARKQQVRSLRFTLPFGALVFAVLYLWVREAFTLRSYFILAVCWLLFALLLRWWWIATVVWTERKLAKKEPRVAGSLKGQYALGSVSVWWALKHYMNWGAETSTTKRAPFIGLLKWLNPFVKLFGLRWLKLRLIQPLVICAVYACLWPVSMVWAVFFLTHELEERDPILKPSWAPAWAPEPTYEKNPAPIVAGETSAAGA